jgi:uncharacterized protein with GYD domain
MIWEIDDRSIAGKVLSNHNQTQKKILNAVQHVIISGVRMILITLARWKKKPTKEMVAQSSKLFEQLTKEGNRILGTYWTLGRYDAIVITEGKDEKTAMKNIMRWGDMLSTESLVAVTREEALKLLE